MCVKNVSATYTETNSTALPGYLPFTHMFGMDSKWDAPGAGFIFGEQKDNFGQTAGNNGWLSTDSLVNSPMIQTHNISLNLRASLEPIRGLKIDLTADRTMNTTKNEFWVYSGDQFHGQNKQYNGSFSISYLTLRTAFWKTNQVDYSNKAFQNFLDDRMIIAQRYADARSQIPEFNYNPNAANQDTSIHRGKYPYGYNSVSQDILIPAFLAAYSGKSASSINTNPFPKIPFPNWTVKYDGLSNITFIKQYVKKVMLSHGYSSKYTVGNYLSEPDFNTDQFLKYGFSNVLDSAKESYLPQYQIGSISIDEKFVPLFGIDVTWKNDLSTKFEYKQSRTLELTFSNNWLLEGESKEYTFGVGYKIPNLELNLKVGGEAKQYKSDLNMRADVTYSDVTAIIRRITEDNSQISSGTKNVSIKITTDYALNKSFTISLFYDQGIITPRVLGYRTSNTKIGFSIRFNLVPQS
jgi:cell surface protein SprA